MSDLRRDTDLDTDRAEDFSQMDRRLNSFRGSTLAEQVSPERLARAGFYFTGHADRVRCFSCNGTVENWRIGDTPVERHKEVFVMLKEMCASLLILFPVATSYCPSVTGFPIVHVSKLHPPSQF